MSEDYNRLYWCYQKAMKAFALPIMDFKHWCDEIDKELEAAREEYERGEIETAQSVAFNPNSEVIEDLG